MGIFLLVVGILLSLCGGIWFMLNRDAESMLDAEYEELADAYALETSEHRVALMNSYITETSASQRKNKRNRPYAIALLSIGVVLLIIGALSV